MVSVSLGIPSHDVLPGVSTSDHHVQTVETVHPDPTVDNAIARYNGVAGALQDYTSQAPTFSDDGILIIPSGQIDFPDTQVPSADANVLDDYEEGVWTPAIADNNLNGSNESQTYSIQIGRYTKIGDRIFYSFRVVLTSLGGLTTTEVCRVVGLPFTSEDTADAFTAVNVGHGGGMAINTGENVGGYIQPNTVYVFCTLWDSTLGSEGGLLLSELTADGQLIGHGHYRI